jgi:hypothetical protein
MMLYIFGFGMPIRDLKGIDTAADALLASSIIALPSFVIGFLLVAIVNIFRKQMSKTWIPNFASRRGAVFAASLIFLVVTKAADPGGMSSLFFAFAAMALVNGKWRTALQ